MEFIKDDFFDSFKTDPKSFVFQVFPDVHGDEGGSFCEVLKYSSGWNGANGCPLWFSNMDWVRQINRSKSIGGTIRGAHAQCGQFCQGKLVEAVNVTIFDIIVDARPNSKTFRKAKAYELSPRTENKLWVPRGFLHSFAVLPSSQGKVVFQYFVDNSYSKSSEITVKPTTVLSLALENADDVEAAELRSWYRNGLALAVFSEKDENGTTFEEFADNVEADYKENGKLWYK